MTDSEIKQRPRTAPDEAIISGIWLSDARNRLREVVYGDEYKTPAERNMGVARAFYYLTAGVASFEPAAEALRKEQTGRRPLWTGFLPARGRREALNACNALAAYIRKGKWKPMDIEIIEHTIGAAHYEFAGMMGYLGYAEITEKDQQRIRDKYPEVGGAGGGR